MAKKIVRPIKGMDLDSSPNRRDDQSVYYAKNLRFNSGESSTLGEYTNIKGINKVIDVPEGVIVGMSRVSDFIIFIIYVRFGDDFISRIKESDIPNNGESIVTLNNDDYYWNTYQGNTYHKVFSGDLSLTNTLLNVKSYFESTNIQKIYWTSGNQAPLRSLNIIKSDSNDPSSYSPSDLDIIPSVDLGRPTIIGTTSGKLLSGKIYYAYSLVNNNGSETNLSEISNGFHLTTSSESESTDFNYKGDGFDVQTGKGIKVTIQNIPSEFTSAKVYSIHYLDDVSLPVVNLIYDSPASGDLTITDAGYPLETFTAEEFLAKNNILLSNGLLEIKNNRLFIANYTEDFFDIDDNLSAYWDARSYRFNPSKSQEECTLYDKDLITSLSLEASNPDYDSIPKNWDCINKDNSPKYMSGTNSNSDYFQSDKTTLGASGKNVSIIQNYDDKNVYPDWTETNTKWNSIKTSSFTSSFPVSGYASYANPKINSLYSTFKLEEIYRLGIQFKNSKQQLSYVKWICDYKVIYDDEQGDLMQGFDGPRIRMTPINLEFTVDNIPIDPDTGIAFEFRIVYVPVEDEDQSAFWGVFNPLNKSSEDSKFKVGMVNKPLSSGSDAGKYLDFVSPEYCFGKKKSYSHIRVYKECSNDNTGYFGNTEKKYHINKAYEFSEYDNLFYELTGQYDLEYSSDIDSDMPLDGSDIFARRTPSTWFGHDLAERGGVSNKGRSQILYPNTPIGGDDNSMYFGCCYADVFESQYGGISYESRKNSGYVALSAFSEESSIVVYGDSSVGIFEYLRLIAENSNLTPDGVDSEIGNPEIIMFPTISRINLNLRSDDFFTKIYTQKGSYMMHEYAGVYEDGSGLNADLQYIFTQETDLYLYNNTYSRASTLNLFYENNESSSIVNSFENRITASSKKTLGEQTDSFLKMNTGSYIDVDGQFGEITSIIVHKERLYFFQERAIGVVAVNERATTNVSDGSSLLLGESGVLSRYDYLTKEFGATDRKYISVAEFGIYFFDTTRMEIVRVHNDSIERLSVLKNIDSLVKNINYTNMSVIFNRKFNEVWFTYRPDDAVGNQDAIVFSEHTNSFVSVNDINSEILLSENINKKDLYDEIVVENDGLTAEVFTLNDGDYNYFNGAYSPSEITFVFNPGNEKNVLFNMIEFIAKGSLDFLSTIRIYNDNYDTGEMSFDSSVDNSFGKFRTSKLRGYVTPGNKERILDNHIFVTIKTGNNSSAQDRIYFRDFIASYSEYNYFG